METFKRIMVALDHTYFDREILKFANYLSGIAKPEKIYFVHVDRNLEMPDYLNFDYSGKSTATAAPKDELLKESLLKEIKKHFASWNGHTMKVKIAEGRPLNELLHWSKIKKIDLILVGNIKLSDGSGITGNKLAREASCSVLFISENVKLPFKKIAVPFDFSGNADYALKAALSLKKEIGCFDLTALHVFDVPLFNYEISVNYHELVENVLKYKEKSFKDYLDKEGLKVSDVTPVFIENTSGRTAKYINDYLIKEEVNLVIMGAKGHSAWDAFLMGSVTEKLLSLNTSNPILVIRRKRNFV
ncbi:MAG: universal stress protein [Leptolyngbya sp. SIO3F4]|nr:universal stress protein [Leptolyngbya sp. SIO3F4]